MEHLGLSMPNAEYQTRNGPYDGTIANNAGCVQRSWREAQRQERIDNHLTEVAVQNVIKNQLELALQRWLLAEIEDRDTGLNN
eukprot:2793349-Ditylum_brightwellii.AAC.1